VSISCNTELEFGHADHLIAKDIAQHHNKRGSPALNNVFNHHSVHQVVQTIVENAVKALPMLTIGPFHLRVRNKRNSGGFLVPYS
jgi:hypothetical protein